MIILFEPAQPQHRAALETLLRSLDLPTEDLPPELTGFTLALDQGSVVGSAGLQRVGPYGLLRSVAVHEAYRNAGLGQQLFAAALETAQADRIGEVWLITNTADRYFERQGFERVERAEAPVEIAALPQFASLCPSTAVVMRKRF